MEYGDFHFFITQTEHLNNYFITYIHQLIISETSSENLLLTAETKSFW